jgi:hypothetical protein
VEVLRLAWYLLQYLIGKLHLLLQQINHYAQFGVSISQRAAKIPLFPERRKQCGDFFVIDFAQLGIMPRMISRYSSDGFQPDRDVSALL